MIRQPEAQALRSTPGALLALGDDGLVAYANPEALRLLGWDHNLIGKPIRVLVPPEFRERQSRAYQDFVQSRRRVVSYPQVQPALGQDGRLRHVYLNVAAFERPDGSLFVCSALGEPRGRPPAVEPLLDALEPAGYRLRPGSPAARGRAPPWIYSPPSSPRLLQKPMVNCGAPRATEYLERI